MKYSHILVVLLSQARREMRNARTPYSSYVKCLYTNEILSHIEKKNLNRQICFPNPLQICFRFDHGATSTFACYVLKENIGFFYGIMVFCINYMILKVRKNVGEISKTGIMIAIVLCTLLEKTQNSLKFLKVSVKKEYSEPS